MRTNIPPSFGSASWPSSWPWRSSPSSSTVVTAANRRAAKCRAPRHRQLQADWLARSRPRTRRPRLLASPADFKDTSKNAPDTKLSITVEKAVGDVYVVTAAAKVGVEGRRWRGPAERSISGASASDGTVWLTAGKISQRRRVPVTQNSRTPRVGLPKHNASVRLKMNCATAIDPLFWRSLIGALGFDQKGPKTDLRNVPQISPRSAENPRVSANEKSRLASSCKRGGNA